jgi:hypothetical protein
MSSRKKTLSSQPRTTTKGRAFGSFPGFGLKMARLERLWKPGRKK